MQLGWLFSEWPGVWLDAMHHAVWRHPSGRLFDVTAKDPGDPVRNVSVFLPDDSLPVDLDCAPQIPTKHLLLTPNASTREFVDAYHQKHQGERLWCQILFAAGYRAEREYAAAAGIEFDVDKLKLAEIDDVSARTVLGVIECAKRRMGSAIKAIRAITKSN